MKPVHSTLREKSFFRKTSNVLLKRFFDRRKVLGDFEWDGRGEADMTELYEAYSKLPNDIREKVEGDLENLNDLASQRGMPCLVDSASRWGIVCRDMTAHDLAMTLFLDCPGAFEAAHDWWTIDHFQGYTDFRGLSPLNVDDPEAGKPQLQAALSGFLSSLDKGIDIHVDVYKDTNKLAYVVCHEDYVKPVERFREHKLVVEKDRPVFYLNFRTFEY